MTLNLFLGRADKGLIWSKPNHTRLLQCVSVPCLQFVLFFFPVCVVSVSASESLVSGGASPTHHHHHPHPALPPPAAAATGLQGLQCVPVPQCDGAG
jgi:hypothetical protein